MENNEMTKETQKKVGKGALIAKIGMGVLAAWWAFKTFAKKDHSHNFMTASASSSGNGIGDVLYITDENQDQFIHSASYSKDPSKVSYDYYGAELTFDEKYSAIVFLTKKCWEISELVPKNGGYDNMRVVIAGNVQLRIPDSQRENYTFSAHVYADQANNNGGRVYFVGDERNGCEVVLFRNHWYFIV